MAWTEERRKAQSDMMKARHQQKVSDTELFIIQNRGAVATEQRAYSQNNEPMDARQIRQVGGATVTVSGPALRRLYKRGTYGWYPVGIPANNIGTVMGQDGMGNYSQVCGDCGTDCGGGETGKRCPSLPEMAFRRCPVCQKVIPDTPPTDSVAVSESDAEIKDDAFVLATPELRTKAKLNAHMRTYHPTEAEALTPAGTRLAEPGRLAGIV